MRIYQLEDYSAMSRRVAGIIAAQLTLKPASTLGLATGSTPVGAYQQLIRWYEGGDVSFAEAKSINLDEYLGLAGTHEQSYRHFMQSNLFDGIDIRRENTFVLNGLAEDSAAECARYEQLIKAVGGIDLQLLGMGHNGHIGFNEPGDRFELDTHVVKLAQTTVDANARFFASRQDVPQRALTMGIRSIMQARAILVAVSGADKADIVLQAFRGPVTPAVPASILQLHPQAILVGDRAALHKLMEAGE